MTTMPDVITAPQAARHNRRRKGYPLPGSYWDRRGCAQFHGGRAADDAKKCSDHRPKASDRG
jgi:hypothetical protein